jgi:hypothetical protein
VIESLLGTSSAISPIDEDVVHSGPCLDTTHSDFLLAPVTNETIKEALFSVGNNKAPGPDGFSSLFFKQSWDIVGADFCAAVKDFFSSGRMLKQINHSILALVPKSAHVNSANDFRPISCCNVVYKVISKILAGRLGSALQSIINPAQNAFLGGRSMTDNINLTQELIRHYGRKRTSPRCLLKVDFKKAFDSVQWPFLRSLLHLLGFPQRFVNLVMLCVETSSYSVAVNGNLYGFFPGKCGVRQGDPLSPYLFLICMEYFSRMLGMASQQHAFHFHPKCAPHHICHLAFADDVLLLCRGDVSSVQILVEQLHAFGRASGLHINAAKSFIYFGGVGDSLKHTILQASGFSEGSFPFKYLGVPLSPHRLLASQFYPLLHQLETAIQSWMGKNLSYAGRLELIGSVLFGMVHFWLNVFPMPESVINRITCLCRTFLWTGTTVKTMSALVAWKSVCLPKAEGGLGLYDIKARNNCFLVKQLWNIHLKADSIWIRWVHHFYLQNMNIWTVPLQQTSSPLWKSFIKLRDRLLDDCGGQPAVISLLQSWNTAQLFSANAYEYLRPKGTPVPWVHVVWESWCLPRHSFILWLTLLKRLRTKDRLRFIDIDVSCVFCQDHEESHAHLFFACTWTSTLWMKVKSWLRLNRGMTTINSAVRGLHLKGKAAVTRMKRVSLSIVVYLIWEERNRRVFENSCSPVEPLFRRFQVLFYMILRFHQRDLPIPI